MVSQEPIRAVQGQLWDLTQWLREKPYLPAELVRDLEQACFRLAAYVADMEHHKLRIDKAWAELEAL